jgi:chitinase
MYPNTAIRYAVWVSRSHLILILLTLATLAAYPQTVPTFRYQAQKGTYSIVGRDLNRGGTTRIPVIVVPVSLEFAAHRGQPLDASGIKPDLLKSPVFDAFPFPGAASTQYGDAMLRASLQHPDDWHTLFAKPQVMKTLRIAVPAGAGYLLTSKSGGALGIADIQFVQQQVFKSVAKQPGSLVFAVTNNTAYYVEQDATICCTWGTHGTDQTTGNSFVLASYLSHAPAIVRDLDVQPLTEQLAEFLIDPLHDPLVPVGKGDSGGNKFPPWRRPAFMRPADQGSCGGNGVGTPYFMLEPTDVNRKNNLPYSRPFTMTHGTDTYHVENVALLPWYLGTGKTFSFPDPAVLNAPAAPCPDRPAAATTSVAAKARSGSANGQSLIGYWTGSEGGKHLPLDEVSPQWDVVMVAFAVPDHHAAEGALRFQPPNGIPPDKLKADIAKLKRQGRKVLISLGGGGQVFTLDQPASTSVFVTSVGRIVREYGFDGIDLDFETPSLMLASGDTDYRRPTTAGIVHIIEGLKQLATQFGPRFMITLVPEGPQMVAGHVTYGGQFGSYLPIAYGIRDILSFLDVQDYNTPPLLGLDGEIYQAGNVNYHAAMTELVLQGFRVGGQTLDYPAVPQKRVAVGFYVLEADVPTVTDSMRYLITGERPANASYRLRNPRGYPDMIGAMFWDIDEDWIAGYSFSNVVGPLLHSFRTHAMR